MWLWLCWELPLSKILLCSARRRPPPTRRLHSFGSATNFWKMSTNDASPYIGATSMKHYYHLQTNDRSRLISIAIAVEKNLSHVNLGWDSPTLKLNYLSLWLALFPWKTMLVEKTVMVELGESRPWYCWRFLMGHTFWKSSEITLTALLYPFLNRVYI